MPAPTLSRSIETLATKAAAEGRWPLAAAAQAVLRAPDELDHQINLVGAIHEVGLLKNSMAPYWKAWRTDPDAWARRCLDRLVGGDHDYWAVAALLGLTIEELAPVVSSAGYVLRAVRWAELHPSGKLHIATFSRPETGSLEALNRRDPSVQTWTGVVELGWETKTGTIFDVMRWRAVSIKNLKTGDNVTGDGSGTLYLRARLPHGSWRGESAPFNLLPEWAMAARDTRLGPMQALLA